MNNMAVENTNQNYCRLCCQTKEHLTYVLDKKDLVEHIERYLQILIFREDALPKLICYACEHEIERIVQFITRCREAQRELNKLSINGRLKITADAIKIEDLPLQISETKIEPDPGIDDLHPDIWNPNKNSVVFTLTVPELPPTDDGKPNSSISIMTNPDSDELRELLDLGKNNLKQLGKNLYKTHILQVQKEQHLKLMFSQLQDDFRRFRESLEEVDPLSQENKVDNKNEKLGSMVPSVVIRPLEITSNTHFDPVDGPTSTNSGLTKADESKSVFLTCPLCPFETTQRFRLTQHQKEVHEKPFPCDQCERRFGKESKLVLHKKTEHTDLPPIICSLCNMSFTQRYHYKQHLKTHSNNDSSWFCNYCKESFSHQHKLDVHMARFHKSKSVKCSRCSYVAAHKYQIKQHVREVHLKPIECAECGKRESKKCRMEAHIRSKHLAKKMYECEICTTKYTSKKWFEAHQKKGCPGAVPISNQVATSVRRLP